MTVVILVLMIIVVYLIAGFLFAIPFLWKGVGQIDEAAKGSGLGFRIIILPGAIVFWPLLLKKMDEIQRNVIMNKKLRRAHRISWSFLAVLLPVGLVLAWLVIPNQSGIQELQKPREKLLPVVVQTRDKKDYEVRLRRDEENWQLEWQIKWPLDYHSAVIYQLKPRINDTILIGRIEARGQYLFPVKDEGGSAFHFILYDFIRDQIIDSINFKP